jgi:hypothetical protein
MYVLIIYGGSVLKIMKEYIRGFSLYINYPLNSSIRKHPSRQCIEKLWFKNISRAEILNRTPEEHIKKLGNVVYYIY